MKQNHDLNNSFVFATKGILLLYQQQQLECINQTLINIEERW